MIATTALPGCGEPQPAVAAANASRLASASFDIGSPTLYEKPGVYTRFAHARGVYLVSNHGMIVALAAQCTNPEHPPAATRWDEVAGVFRCGTCDARFTRDGLNRGKSRAPVALKRCRLHSSGKIYAEGNTLIIDPDKLYSQEAQEWSHPTSLFPLSEIQSARPKDANDRKN